VRYEYNGSLIALPYGQQRLLHQAPRLCVQRSKWLIHKKTLRVSDKDASDCHRVAHSSGKLMGVATFESKQTNDLYLIPSPWHLAQLLKHAARANQPLRSRKRSAKKIMRTPETPHHDQDRGG
jgi:hypothetical protein